LSKRSNDLSVGCVGGEARGEIVGLRSAWQQSGRAGIMRMAGVGAEAWRRGRGGVDVVALAWTPAAVVRCRSRFAWCGTRTRALAHGGGRSTASSLRSGIPLADVLAPPGCARTLRRRARHVGRPSREWRVYVCLAVFEAAHWESPCSLRALAVPARGACGAGEGSSRCRRGGFVSAPSESGVGGQEFPPDVAGTSSGGLTVPPSPAGFGVGAGPGGRENPKKYRTALDRTDGVGEPIKHRTPIGTDTVLAQVGEENRQNATK
jgi:hypothetical protein